MNTINKLAKIANLNGIEISNRLRDPIVEEYNEVIDSLNTIEESVIVKDINQLPVYKINEGLFNKKKELEKDQEPVKEYKTPTKNDYNKAIQIAKKLLNNKYKSIKSAFKVEPYDPRDNYTPILYYEVDSLKIKSMDEYNEKFSEPLTNFCNDIKNELKKNKIIVDIDVDGTNNGFVYIQNNTIIKESNEEAINESLAGDYESVMGYNISFIQRKMPLSWTKRSKESLEKTLDKYETRLKEFKKMSEEEKEKYCFKINAQNAARSAAIAVGTTAASSYASDGNYSLTYIEIPSKITPYNYPGIVEKMIKKLKYDINKLDGIVKHREKAKGIKEGYAIDLDSLKYVVKSEQCTLQEAVQIVKDVNYIGDTYTMYCVLPRDINENMSLDNLMELCNILQESDINVLTTKEYSSDEFIKEKDKK